MWGQLYCVGGCYRLKGTPSKIHMLENYPPVRWYVGAFGRELGLDDVLRVEP